MKMLSYFLLRYVNVAFFLIYQTNLVGLAGLNSQNIRIIGYMHVVRWHRSTLLLWPSSLYKLLRTCRLL